MTRVRTITVNEAAAVMGKSSLFVREAMRRELLPIGTAMQMPGSTRWNFFISPPMLAEYLGITVDVLWEALGDDEGDEEGDEE